MCYILHDIFLTLPSPSTSCQAAHSMRVELGADSLLLLELLPRIDTLS